MKRINLFFLVSFAYLSLHAQSYQQYWFKNVPFGGGGNVTGIITCPTQKNLIYARTDVGGIFRWIEATKSWKSLNFTVPKQNMNLVESIAIDPQIPNRVYATCGESYFGSSYLLRSSDYGNTWEYISLAPYFQTYANSGGGCGGKGSGERLRVDPNKSNILYYGTYKSGLWKSNDYGSTWVRVESFPIKTTQKDQVGFVEILKDFGTPGQETPYIIAGVDRIDKVAPVDSASIYLSTDKGVTWTAISDEVGNGTTKPDINWLPGNMAYAAGKIYVAFGGATAGVTLRSCLWQYDIKNKIWKDVSPSTSTDGGVNAKIHGVSVDNPTNPTTIVVSTNDVYIYLPWGNTSYGDDMYKGSFDANGNIKWLPRIIGNGLAKYDPKWFVQNVQIHRGWDVEIDPFNKNRVFITSGNGLYSTDNFMSVPSIWYANVKGLEETATMNAVSIPGGKFMLALGDISGGVYSDPTQYGVRYNPTQAVTTSVDYAPQTTTTMMLRAGTNATFAGGVKAPIMYSNDGGIQWTPVPITTLTLTPALPNPLTSADKAMAYGWAALSCDGKAIAYGNTWQVNSVKYYSLFYSRDKGTTWTEFPLMNAPARTSSSRIYSDKVNPNVFYAMTNSKLAVYTWNNDSLKYLMKTYATPAGEKMQHYMQINPTVEGEFLAWSESKLYRYYNKGANYEQITSMTYCQMAGWGKAAPGKNNLAIFAYGKIDAETTMRIYRSDDMGASWVQVTDDSQQFGGGPIRDLIFGDMNVYGRVYMTNYGIGLVYGDIDKSTYTKSILVKGTNSVKTVLSNNGNLQMVAQFVPSYTTNQKVFWEVDNTALATIDSTGMLTGKKAGDVKIIAWALDGSGNFGVGSIKVTDPLSSIHASAANSVSVYPNPFKSSAHVVSEKWMNYRIITLNGTLIESGVVSGNTQIGALLANGVYLLELTDPQSAQKQRIKLIKN